MAKEQLKPRLLSAAVAAGLASTVMSANALKLGASGQINKIIQHIDNGNDSALGIFDNVNSGTRIRFRGSEELDNGLTLGGYMEWQMSNTPSCCTGFNGAGEFGQTSATFTERFFEITLAGGFGKVSLGQGDGAANGTFEQDISGTFAIDYSQGNPCLIGGITFGTTTITSASVFVGFDGESRNQRLRYDSPKLGNVVSLAGSLANGGQTEVAAWFDATVGSTRIAAAIGHSDRADNNTATTATVASTDRERFAVSASLLLGNGLNFTIASSSQELAGDPDDDELTYFKLGYKKGKHALSLSVGESDNFEVSGFTGVSSEAIALGYVYTGIPNLELYGGFRQQDEPDTNQGAIPGADDISVVALGARLKWQ